MKLLEIDAKNGNFVMFNTVGDAIVELLFCCFDGSR
jgi:hypothetical protein